MRTRKPARKGSAVTEFAILMLVFVPLILVPLYFQDAIRYKLSAQEAVYSTVWDFAFADYSKKDLPQVATGVTKANREIYANLRTADRKAKTTPAGPWADFAWEKELACVQDKGFAAGAYSFLAQSFHNSAVGTKGGLVTCSGAISVANHFVPKVFLPEFSRKSLLDTTTTVGQRQAANNAQPGAAQPNPDAILYKEIQSGMLVDPWCIHDASDAERDGDGNPSFKERVTEVWSGGYAWGTHLAFTTAWKILAVMGIQLVNPFIDVDNPASVKLSSLHPADRQRSMSVSGGRSSFFVTPIDGPDGSKYRQTYEARTGLYLGCQAFGPNCNR